jgi:hypothetical protein
MASEDDLTQLGDAVRRRQDSGIIAADTWQRVQQQQQTKDRDGGSPQRATGRDARAEEPASDLGSPSRGVPSGVCRCAPRAGGVVRDAARAHAQADSEDESDDVSWSLRPTLSPPAQREAVPQMGTLHSWLRRVSHMHTHACCACCVQRRCRKRPPAPGEPRRRYLPRAAVLLPRAHGSSPAQFRQLSLAEVKERERTRGASVDTRSGRAVTAVVEPVLPPAPLVVEPSRPVEIADWESAGADIIHRRVRPRTHAHVLLC